MFQRFMLAALFSILVFGSAAGEETALRQRTVSIMQLRQQNNTAAARAACEATLPMIENPDAAVGEQATLLTTCGNLYGRTGELAKSRLLLESALSLWRKLFGDRHSQVAATSLDLAVVYRLEGRHELAERHARRALEIDEANYGPDSAMLSPALTGLGLAEITTGRYADAEANLRRALALLESMPKQHQADAAAAFSGLGLLCFRQGRYLEAERAFRRAGELRGSGPDFARDLANLARVFLAMGRYGRAEVTGFQALDLLTESFGPNQAEVGLTLQILAQVRHAQKRFAEGTDLLNRALDIALRAPAPDRLNESIVRNSIGMSHILEGRYAEAEASFRKAIPIQESLGRDGRMQLSVTLHNLAFACEKQGRRSEALELVSRALALRESDLQNIDANLVEIMMQKADLLRKSRRKTEAAKLEQAARQARAERSDQDPHRWMVDFRELQRKKWRSRRFRLTWHRI